VTGLPVLALTQGDPAGIGPEQILKVVGAPTPGVQLLVVAEKAALEALRSSTPSSVWERLVFLGAVPEAGDLPSRPAIPVLDPVAEARTVKPGEPTAKDAAGALAALDVGLDLVRGGVAQALVTGPVAKASIARRIRPDFRGQTEYLAQAFDLDHYGRDFLMAFIGGDLQVALLSTHLPLRSALDQVTEERLLLALRCLSRHAPGQVAVPGVNPHAGEDGLLGGEEDTILKPALERAREELPELRIRGPESPDSLFGRATELSIDWILALYHDQGLIAVKTHAWGRATNWTLGLPIIRTSVDHGTAFEIAGQNRARAAPLRHVVDTTLGLLEGRLPRGSSSRAQGEEPWS
jgi:4-hydroxythreonine-4-phosphate dehydrogenase